MVYWTLVIVAIIIVWLYRLNKDYAVPTLFTKRVKTVDGTSVENSVVRNIWQCLRFRASDKSVDTFMFEGYDTTSMALLFSLMNLSLYPEMQERCYQEILENVEDSYPIAWLCLRQLTVIAREVAKDTRLANNVILPKGSQITIHIIDIHRSAKYYENPNKFDPEHFTAEASVGRHPFAYVPFSAGQRNCIGQKFAMLELKTVLINIIKKFKISLLKKIKI